MPVLVPVIEPRAVPSAPVVSDELRAVPSAPVVDDELRAAVCAGNDDELRAAVCAGNDDEPALVPVLVLMMMTDMAVELVLSMTKPPVGRSTRPRTIRPWGPCEPKCISMSNLSRGQCSRSLYLGEEAPSSCR